MDILNFVYWTHTWDWWHWSPVWVAAVVLMVWIYKEG